MKLFIILGAILVLCGKVLSTDSLFIYSGGERHCLPIDTTKLMIS